MDGGYMQPHLLRKGRGVWSRGSLAWVGALNAFGRYYLLSTTRVGSGEGVVSIWRFGLGHCVRV